MNRAERRAMRSERRGVGPQVMAALAARRKSGDWPAWERRSVAPGEVGNGPWLREIHTAYRNDVYAVLVRTVATAWGPVEHASIHTLGGGDIPWCDKQRIKNGLFGADRVAVEVFPAAADLVDQADAYHVWVLPAGFRLPFTIAPGSGP